MSLALNSRARSIEADEVYSKAARFPTKSPRTEPVGSCPLCGKSDSTVFLRLRDQLHGTPGEFTYRRCDACCTVFQDPRVCSEDLARCYPADYYTHESESEGEVDASSRFRELREILRCAVKVSVQRRPAPFWLKILGRVLSLSSRLRSRAFFDLADELIPRDPDRVRALEVGCGAGTLMVRLQRGGWNIEGVERDPVAVDVARPRTRCAIWEGDFFEIALPQRQYDLVVLSHVLEHVPDPIRALKRIKDLLAPDGRVVLFYPNPDSLGARTFGSGWFHWDPPRHLVLPTLRSLAMAAEQAGLKPMRCRTRSGLSVPRFVRSAAMGSARTLRSLSPAGVAVSVCARILATLGFAVGEEAIMVMENADPEKQ